jgi:hypothetical protein
MTAQEHISKVARMLANQQADACGVDREDNWRLYGEEFIAATAEAMSSVLAHIDQQQAEIERLRSESEERLQNCAALVAEVEGLRAAPATAPEPVAWLAHYVGRSGMEQEYVSTDKTLADENDASGKAWPLYLHPAHKEAEVQGLLSVASKNQIGEMDAIEVAVRRILGVPAP